MRGIVRVFTGLAAALPVLVVAAGCSIFGGGDKKDAKGVLSPDADVRREAIVSMGDARDHRAVPVLTDRLLKDPDNLVRAAAARALGRMRERDTGPYLVAALKDEDEHVRWEACVALGFVADPATVPDLIKVLGNDPSADCRREAAKSLGTMRQPAGIEALISALADRDEGVRKKSYKALLPLTGQDFGMEREKWEEWFRNQGQPPAAPPPGTGTGAAAPPPGTDATAHEGGETSK